MEPIVTTELGKIKGVVRNNHLEFLGIRYGSPPIGDLRFSEPFTVDSWEGVYDASRYASMAPQVWTDDPPIELGESEDCLFLNVYTPATDSHLRPVMFYIHGGAYGIGSGSRPRLYGGHLAEHGDVVVVTIQYRLGPLGFLYMDGIPPNLGLKDQICALRWVKDNIADFGGDPGNVTIFGQSAGSISVSYLLTMPDAKGLFHRAIAQSATLPLIPSTPEKATNTTEMFLSKLNVAYGDVEALQTLNWKQIIQAQSKIAKDILSDNHHSPVLDSVSIPTDPLKAVRTGFAKGIPLMIGHTSNEVPIFEGFINSSNFIVRYLAKRMVTKRLLSFGLKKSDLQRVLEWYRNSLADQHVPNQEYDQLITDMGFRLPSIIVADARSSSQSATYFYEFAHKAPKLGTTVHVLDLFFVFGTLDTTDISDAMKLTNSESEKALSRKMMDTWTIFARTGDPNNENLPTWQKYNNDDRPIMLLDNESSLVTNHLDDRIEFWKSLNLL